MAAATAYISDVAPSEERARLFGLIGATFGVGFVVGPALGGLLGQYALRLPFIAAAALSFANVCFGLFVLPESLPADHRRALTWERATAFICCAGSHAIPSCGGCRLHGHAVGSGSAPCRAAWCCSRPSASAGAPLFSGAVLAGVGLSQAVVEGFLLRHVTGRIGERGTAIAGYVSGAIGYGMLALAARWTMLPAIALIALGGLATPSVRAMVAGRGGVDH